METLAYLNVAVAYEEPAIERMSLFEGCNWKKLPSYYWMRWLSVALSLSLLSVTSNAMALQRGDSGPAVTDLQIRLNAAGYYNGPITGYYGRLTETAVQNFQKAKKLPNVGVAGSQTYAALRQSENIVAIAPKNSSTAIADIQRKLVAQGYNPGLVDGIYGSQTQAAIKKFQADNGLMADGIVGKNTSSALFA